MILYHGSNQAIERIDLAKGRRAKDFGKGFYLNPSRGNALEWAAKVVDREESGEPVITAYEFDEACLTDGTIKVKIFEEYSLEWVDFIIANRHNRTNQNLHDYDIVVGPIADDDVGTQLFRFDRGYIDKDVLVEKLKSKKPQFIQYFFSSEAAVSYLSKCHE